MKKKHFDTIQSFKNFAETKGAAFDLYYYVDGDDKCLSGKAEVDFRLGHFENVMGRPLHGIGEPGGLGCNLAPLSDDPDMLAGKFSIMGHSTTKNPWKSWGSEWEGVIHETVGNIGKPFLIPKSFFGDLNLFNKNSPEVQEKLYELYLMVIEGKNITWYSI